MRRIVIVFAVALTAWSGWSPADACGDKLLLVGRGVKYRKVYASLNPGRILIYAHSQTSAAAAIRDPQLQKNLKQAGHQLTVVEDAGLLDQALRSGFDILLADVREAPALGERAATSASAPTVLYVTDEKDKARAEGFLKQFNCRLKASDKPQQYLEQIEKELKARAAAGRQRRQS